MTHWTEAAIARELDGKFFDIDGFDRNELKRLRDEERAQRVAAEIAKKREAEKKKLRALIQKSCSNRPPKASPRAVIAAVAFAHSVSAVSLSTPSREKKITAARQHACFIMRELTGLSFPRIGSYVKRDHSTVIHAWQTWPGRRSHFARQEETVLDLLGVGQ